VKGVQNIMSFFTVTDDSFRQHSNPWVISITNGLHYLPRCKGCGCEDVALDATLEVALMQNKGSKWPDALGCGAFPLMIISVRAVEAWHRQGFGPLPLKRIVVRGHVPRKLRAEDCPGYFCVDGLRLCGARLDPDASGYSGVQRCVRCGVTSHDPTATREKQRDRKYPFVLVAQSWQGLPLFTTDLERYTFFCSEEFVTMSRRYRLSNFRFVPIEDRGSYHHEGLHYLDECFHF